MDINKIIQAFEENKILFNSVVHHEMFRGVLENYINKNYVSSAAVGVVLFETIITTLLIGATSFPKDFKPSKENVSQQFEYIMKREDEVINGINSIKQRGLPFYKITEELEQIGMSVNEKKELDEFYKKIRIPVSHGFTSRLYELVYYKKPSIYLDYDVNSDYIYKIISEKIIFKIYELCLTKKILQK